MNRGVVHSYTGDKGVLWVNRHEVLHTSTNVTAIAAVSAISVSVHKADIAILLIVIKTNINMCISNEFGVNSVITIDTGMIAVYCDATGELNCYCY